MAVFFMAVLKTLFWYILLSLCEVVNFFVIFQKLRGKDMAKNLRSKVIVISLTCFWSFYLTLACLCLPTIYYLYNSVISNLSNLFFLLKS